MITIEDAIKELKDASYSEARYGDKDNHRDKVMKRIEAFDMAIKRLEELLEIHDNCKKCIEFSNFEPQPFEDCISREALLDKLEEPMNWTDSEAELQEQRDYEGFIELVKSMPSITPTRPKGKWIAQDIHNCHTNFKCSECSYIHNFTHPYGEPTAVYPYCPICGADMRGETE